MFPSIQAIEFRFGWVMGATMPDASTAVPGEQTPLLPAFTMMEYSCFKQLEEHWG